MRKSLLMISILLLMAFLSSGVYAQDQQFIIMPQTKETSRDFLDMFTEEEKCIILAIEPQLETFAMFYSYHHKGMTFTASDITLFDVGSLLWNSKDKTLDGFLDYIIAPSLNFITNVEINIEAFKKKAHFDHNFVTAQRQREKKEEDKRLKKEMEDKAFTTLLRRIYKAFVRSSQGRRALQEIERELEKFEKK